MADTGDQHTSINDYTVACICAMSLELAAIEGMLEEIYESVPFGWTRDFNAYTFGRLHEHHVVVAVMSEIGTNQAAAVALQLLNDFPSIRFGLLVGIGGGVPGTADIRLGDVVVGVPTGIFGGVVQYDMGKRNGNGGFQRTGTLNKPPQVLGTHVQKLASQHQRRGHQLSALISEMLQRNPRMQAKYSFPPNHTPSVRDVLYDASYFHQPGASCSQCDQRSVIKREPRPSDEPQIHYGTIGSANTVIKDASIREELKRDLDLLCVEMEAAGLMNTFPCLVIRGICDYADSHKNDRWQPYAAAVASAYMKELLRIIPARQVLTIPQAVKVDASSLHSIGLTDRVDAHQVALRPPGGPSDIKNPSEALRDTLYYENMDMKADGLNLSEFPHGSFEWIWSTSFRKWLTLPTPFYWIKGMPGSGKSMLMKYIVKASKTKELLRKSDSGYKIVHFFFDYRVGKSAANNEIGLMKRFMLQLCDNDYRIKQELEAQNARRSLRGARFEQMLDSLCSILETGSTKICAFIDGLDEYTGDHNRFVQQLIQLQERTSVNICLASRSEPAFQRYFEDGRHVPSLLVHEHNQDSVRMYIQHIIDNNRDRMVNIDKVIDVEIRVKILNRARGVLIWTRLALDHILQAMHGNPSKHHLLALLDRLPEDLEQMYDRAFLKISEKNRPEAALLLFVLNELGGQVDEKVLQQARDFLEDKDTDHGFVSQGSGGDAFRRRLDILISSFIQVIDVSKAKEEAFLHKTRLMYHASGFGSSSGSVRNTVRTQMRLLKYQRTHREQIWAVRLMHQTLQPYLQHSAVIKKCLSLDLCSKFAESFKSRLYAEVICAATDTQLFTLENLGRSQHFTKAASKYDCSWPKATYCFDTLKPLLTDSLWQARLDLLVQSILGFPQAAHKQCNASSDIYATWKKALKSPLMLLELPYGIGMEPAAAMFHEYRDHMDLRLAIEYGLPDYIEQAVRGKNNESPSPAVWTRLLFEAVYVLWMDAAGASHYHPVHCNALRRHRRSRMLNLSRLQGVLNIIRTNCDMISVDLFRFILQIRVTDKLTYPLPTNRIQAIEKLLVSTRGLPVAQLETEKAVQITSSALHRCKCVRSDHLIHLWIANPMQTDGLAGYCRHRPVYRNPHPSADRLCMVVVEFMRNADNGVNGVCKEHGTALNFWARLQCLLHYSFWIRGIDTLIVLAKLGADPNVEHEGKTPLQALFHAKKKARIQHHPAFVLFSIAKTYLRNISVMIDILQHHKTHGSWPDFDQIVRTHNLKGPALWEVNESGQLVIDRDGGSSAEKDIPADSRTETVDPTPSSGKQDGVGAAVG